jgi:hypothetical protein
MIKRVLLATLVGLLAYSWFIYRFGADINRTGQTTEQRNMVKAEEFLYEASARYDTIIIGSSLSDRLNTDSLSTNYYNLSLAGLSVLDGIQLVELSQHLPSVVFIETYTLPRDEPSALVASLNNPTQVLMKRYLPFTRQKYQPAGVFKAMLRDWSHGKGNAVVPESAMYVDTAFLNKAVTERLEQGSFPPPDSLLQNGLLTVRARLEAWRKRGVQIVLYEMPLDARLKELPEHKRVRQLVSRYFPSPDYGHITLPPFNYQTTDGIHLTYQDANRFTGYMRQQINTLMGERYLVNKE